MVVPVPRKPRVGFPGAVPNVRGRGIRLRSEAPAGPAGEKPSSKMTVAATVSTSTRYGELGRESAELRAERVIAEELRSQGWTAAKLGQRRERDPAKLALAAQLRRAFAAP